jgi:flagellar assembly factor FliW
MDVVTSRFGRIAIEAADVIHFPAGILGLHDCRQWVLLADAQDDALAWMQCVDRPAVALAVVSPRRFVPGYQLRVARNELAPLKLDDVKKAKVLLVLGRSGRAMTLNLKAPIVVNLDHRLGRQVIANGDLPVQHLLESEKPTCRRIA